MKLLFVILMFFVGYPLTTVNQLATKSDLKEEMICKVDDSKENSKMEKKLKELIYQEIKDSDHAEF